MVDDPKRSDHPSPHELAAFVDGDLSTDDRNRFLRHVSECEACRTEMREVVALVEGRRPRWRRAAGPVAALAATLVLLVPLLRLGPDEVDVVRSTTFEAESPAIALLDPREEIGSADPIRFTWHALGEGLTYQLVLSNDDGEIVWRATLSDTVATPGPGLRLPQGRYSWQVEALLEDGGVARSSRRRLDVR
jgi:hypothetical protein